MLRPVVFGEALFDHFPDGSRVLGGAPFNVAWHLQGFGAHPVLISRVGDDAEGREIIARMRAWGMSTDAIQIDERHPTGRVTVTLPDGEPSFAIEANQAYDHIAFVEDRLASSGEVGLLYHGTLALRSETSLTALRSVAIALAAPMLCDVNLRPPWWTPELVSGILTRVSWAKLNRDEVRLLDGDRGDGLEAAAQRLRRTYDLEGLIVTRGADGALGLFNGEMVHVPAVPVRGPGDPVGAGDAFSAVVILGLLGDWPPAVMLRRAAAFAGEICAIVGATSDRRELYTSQMQTWTHDGG